VRGIGVFEVEEVVDDTDGGEGASDSEAKGKKRERRGMVRKISAPGSPLIHPVSSWSALRLAGWSAGFPMLLAACSPFF